MFFAQDPKWTDPHTKANVLLQCHFSRKKLTSDMEDDRRVVLEKAVPLVQAMVDVIASNRWLNPALAAMELSQMITQGLWDKDSILMQLPHFTSALAKKCTAKGIESVFDLLELEDATRKELLGFTEARLRDLAVVCNKYPNINVEYEVIDKEDIHAGQPVTVQVHSCTQCVSSCFVALLLLLGEAGKKARAHLFAAPGDLFPHIALSGDKPGQRQGGAREASWSLSCPIRNIAGSLIRT